MNEKLGNRIKELRSAKQFTQEQIAEQIGVSRQKYARIESGVNSVTLDILSKIAAVLDVTVGDITKACMRKTSAQEYDLGGAQMQESTEREIRIKANSLREKCNVSRYGIVDLFKDCESLGYKLLRYPLGENADLGFSVKKDNDTIIFTNELRP